jgi:hypothetical protein
LCGKRRVVLVRAVRGLGRGAAPEREMIAKNFGFHGILTANKLSKYRDHGQEGLEQARGVGLADRAK